MRTAWIIGAAAALLALPGCGGDTKPSDPPPPDAADLEVQTLSGYADLAGRQFSAAARQATALRSAVEAFLSSPTTATMAAARQAWVTSRPAYLNTEAFRFYGGPIDDPDTGREPFINAWPLDEAYIDYVDGDPGAGIINKPAAFPQLDAETIAAQNEKGGETNIATGFHAVEFLLWGQDSDPAGAGKRPATDFTPGGPSNADRRRQYLKVVTEVLEKDLQGVAAAWDPSSGAYRRQFLAEAPKEGLRRILTGMGTLSGGELAGERINVPYESKDQEDEHSCFSDNTTVDHLEDARGIQLVWKVLEPLVRSADPALAATYDGQATRTVEAAAAIPRPFDQAILGNDDTPGRKAILATLTSLEAQTATTVRIAEKLGVKINTSV